MKQVMNFALYDGCLKDYGDMAGVKADCDDLGLDGVEVIWDHRPYTEELPPSRLVVGHHMLFFSWWYDFWRGNTDAVMAELGDESLIEEYFHGPTREAIIASFKADLVHALDMRAEYLVFHVSDVALEECFTRRFAHSDFEVIDAAAEIINEMLDGIEDIAQGRPLPALLCENLWWPGLNLTDPAQVPRLMDAIEYDNKGIMLDIGHLLHTNTKLRSQAQAAQYVSDIIDGLGPNARYVRGLHLQQALSGEYVEGVVGKVSDDFAQAEGYWNRYTACYRHIVQIDRHQPWTDPAIVPVIDKIGPEWINHELSGWPREKHDEAVRTQLATLRAGGLGR